MPDQPCLQGGGCLSRTPACAEDSSRPLVDSEAEDSAVFVNLEGSTCNDSCHTASAAPSPWLIGLLAIVLWRRQRRALGAVLGCIVLLVAMPAVAQDVRPWMQLDGGALPGFVEPAPPPPWSLRTAVAVVHAEQPVRERTTQGSRDFVPSIDTLEVAGSLQLGTWFRVGASLPLAQTGFADGTSVSELGAPTLFLLREANDKLVMDVVLVQGRAGAPFTAGPGFGFGLTTRQPLALADLLVRVRFRGQWPVRTIGGVQWGNRLEWAVGGRTHGRVSLGAQVVGSAPVGLFWAPARGAWPVEVMPSWHYAATKAFEVDVFGGIGLTAGLGSSRWRLGASLRFTGTLRDRDQDRVLDVFDRCDDDPEDRDRFRDRDGCPEPDNDLDGFVDEVDGCPVDPETPNGYQDDDGCPDALAALTVRVTADEPTEQVYIAINGEGGWQLALQRTVTVPPGDHRVEVKAAGHLDWRKSVPVPEDGRTVDVWLRPIRYARCTLAVQSTDGAPLAATWDRFPDAVAIPAEGITVDLPRGVHEGSLRAEGHLETFVSVTAADPCTATWTLTPGEPSDPVRFVRDSAELDDRSGAALDALAAWLFAHPEVQRLRVTGHADPPGTPAYNLALSLQRAEAVVAALVRRGVATTRLEPAGDGEARRQLTVGTTVEVREATAPLRQVDFIVLVWDEAQD